MSADKEFERVRNMVVRSMLDNMQAMPKPAPGGMRRVWWDGHILKAENISPQECLAPSPAPAPPVIKWSTVSDPYRWDDELTGGPGITCEADIANRATLAERERIRAELVKLAPTETQYTRLEWRHEERGAQRLFDKVMRAIDASAKKGE